MEICRITERLLWIKHPTAQGVEIKPLVTQNEDGLDVTCMLVQIPAGIEVPEHIHPKQDDILYPLSGRGTMWVDGTGEFPLVPGVIVRVPQGTKHKIFGVTDDLLIFDVFCPALM